MKRALRPLHYGSVCSGIEAVTVAMKPDGWIADWFAEIDAFPSSLLAHHYPDVPNLGDMTAIADNVRRGEVAAPDVLVGGTPCQAFSVAGLREGLKDQRGQLTLSFVELADDIDAARLLRGQQECVVWWENVPGVLSSGDNAFGCFLGALAGEVRELQPAGGKWANAGCVFGPKRTIAWRVLDAQYFGVAQRRRRVFIVASARNGFDPVAVLFESDGVRRDTPPSREAQEDVAGTIRASAARRGGIQDECGLGLQPVTSTLDANYGRLQGCSGQDANHGHSHLVPVAYGGNNQHGSIDIATTRTASASATGRLDFASETFLVHPVDQPHPPVIAFSSKDYGGDAMMDLSPTLRSGNHHHSHANGGQPPAIAFDSRQDPVSSQEVFGSLGSSSPQAQAVAYAIQAGALRTNPESGPDGIGVKEDIAYTLEARSEVQVVCATYASREIAGAITSSYGKQPDSSDSALGPNLAICVTGDVTHTLKAEGFDASEDGTGRGQPIIAFQNRFRGDDGRGYDRAPPASINHVGTLETVKQWNVSTGMAVRRLTPIECERLQAFPDNYTRIPIRYYKTRRITKLRPADIWEPVDGGGWLLMAADGPRYKTLGNSMCVLNMRWIGKRISHQLRLDPDENFTHEREIARVA